MPLYFHSEDSNGEKGVINYFTEQKTLSKYVTTFGSPVRETDEHGDYKTDNILTLTKIPFYASEESKLNLNIGISLPYHDLIC